VRKHLLVVGGHDTSAVQASRLDIDVTLFQSLDNLTQEQMNAVRRFFVFDIDDLGEALALARAVHAVHPFDAVVSFWETSLLAAAVIGETLGIAANPVRPVAVTRDKLAMRELLAANHRDHVRFRRCDSPADVSRFLAEVGRPIILKPTDGSGSAGVSRIDSESEVGAAWEWATATGLAGVFAEEYLEGVDYSVESISLGGKHRILGITPKTSTGAPHFIETGHWFPADLPPATAARIEASVIQFLGEIGHVVGPACTEVGLTAAGPVIVETQTRLGGNQIWEMVELVTGVNQTRSTCAHLLGLPQPPARPRAGGAAIRFFAYENGTVTDIRGMAEARAHPGVVRITCKLKNGMTLGPIRSAASRQGYVMVTASSGPEAWRLAGEVMDGIRVTFEPADN